MPPERRDGRRSACIVNAVSPTALHEYRAIETADHDCTFLNPITTFSEFILEVLSSRFREEARARTCSMD